MPTYRVVFLARAARQILELPPDYYRLVRRHINALAQNPRPHGSKKLEAGLGYSLRVGVYRVIYDVDDQARTVTVRRVKHRREVYR
jgi:mRNA interferase RelE/StbE